MAQAGCFPVGEAGEDACGYGVEECQGGRRGEAVKRCVRRHDRHSGNEGDESLDAREGGETVGGSLPQARYAAEGESDVFPAGSFAAPGGAADEKPAGAGRVGDHKGAVVVEQLAAGKFTEPEARMCALAGAAAAHEQICAPVDGHGRGVEHESSLRGRKLGEENACHGVEREITVGVGGVEGKCGFMQRGVDCHEAGIFAGAGSHGHTPEAADAVEGGAAEVVVRYRQRFGIGQRGTAGRINYREPDAGSVGAGPGIGNKRPVIGRYRIAGPRSVFDYEAQAACQEIAIHRDDADGQWT